MKNLAGRLLIGIATFGAIISIHSTQAFAAGDPCPDELANLQTALHSPKGFNGYGYFCHAKGKTRIIENMLYDDGCIVIKGGPFQVKFPKSNNYANSTQYQQYMDSLRADCKAIDPEASIVARFYAVRKDGPSIPPVSCDLVNGSESCSGVHY